MPRRTYPVLDAMRGVAALSVLLFHATGLVRFIHDPSLPEPASHGYLAVDFFYMLSGFVVAHAYGERLQAGWAPSAFLGARLRRLYPTAMLGLGLGVAVDLALHAVHGELTAHRLVFTLLEAALGVLLVPMLGSEGGDAFPFDGPLWSLSQELGANAAYGYARRRGSPALLGVVCGLGAAACMAELLAFGRLEAGTAPNDFLFGFARIAYAFPLGVLIQRAHAAGLTRRLKPAAVLPVAVLVLALACPSWKGTCAWVDGACVFLLFPLLLAAASEAEAPQGYGRLAAGLSFPLYATHMALRPIWLEVLPALSPVAGLVLVLAASLLLAWVAQALLEGRLRSWFASPAVELRTG